MDEAGFAPVAAVLAKIGLSESELDRILAEDRKSRFERRGDRVRAVQGHSLEGTPVTMHGLEASWQRWEGDELLWHGTTLTAALSIARVGALAMSRTHVHLAPTPDSRVGKRAQVEVLLGVSPEVLRTHAQPVWRSPNGVLLVREVPAAAVVAMRAGRRGVALDELAAAFGVVAKIFDT